MAIDSDRGSHAGLESGVDFGYRFPVVFCGDVGNFVADATALNAQGSKLNNYPICRGSQNHSSRPGHDHTLDLAPFW